MSNKQQTPSNNARIEELDVLRGFALLGVFIVHFVGVAFYELPHEAAIKEQWTANIFNKMALLTSDFLFLSKANTLFATLFGIGFWVMLDRLEQSGRNFKTIYLRRLFFLFLMGITSAYFIFPGDVLHEYAVLGFLLFLIKKMPAKHMFIIGIVLAIVARPLFEYLLQQAGVSGPSFREIRDQAILSGDYSYWLKTAGWMNLQNQIFSGAILTWGMYILGRFMIGTWHWHML